MQHKHKWETDIPTDNAPHVTQSYKTINLRTSLKIDLIEFPFSTVTDELAGLMSWEMAIIKLHLSESIMSEGIISKSVSQ